MEDTELKIEAVCKNFAEFLKQKNKSYGDSALSPLQIFSKNSAANSITIRLDDKLGRIMKSDRLRKNDVVDLAGYLILLMITENWTNFDDLMN